MISAVPETGDKANSRIRWPFGFCGHRKDAISLQGWDNRTRNKQQINKQQIIEEKRMNDKR